MRSLLGIPVAIVILALTMALGAWVHVRNDKAFFEQLVIETTVQDMIAFRRELSTMLMLAALERNPLGHAQYEVVAADLSRAAKDLASLTAGSALSSEIDALTSGQERFLPLEHQAIGYMHAGRWDDATTILFGNEYKLNLSVFEVDGDITVLAMKAQHAIARERLEQVRMATVALNFGAMLLLLWVGWSFSRALKREVVRLKESQTELAESEGKLRRLAEHQQSAREAAMKSLAQEIHDELGQRLTVLRMDVAMLPAVVKADPAARLPAKVAELKDGIDGILAIVRDISGKLRPTALDVGLGAAADSLVQEFRESLHIPVAYSNALPADLVLDDERATAMFRILQESLTNVARHARARNVSVSLLADARHLRLSVRDDGLGFDVAPGASFGISGMRERAASLGGRLDVSSVAGAGTTIEAELPLSNRQPTGVVRPQRAPDGDAGTALAADAPSGRAAR